MQRTTISTNPISTKPVCPVCKGVCGVEAAPGDWFDCEACDATGIKKMIVYTDRASLSKWDARFLELAEHIATWSKGPRKRIGAVIVRPDRSIASLGYNGPPRGFNDEAFLRMSRDEQHAVVIHAEDNALRQMASDDLDNLFRRRANGYTIYISPLFPCADCARRIVESNIRRVVAYCGHISQDWRTSAEEAERIFIQHNVECLFMFEGA